MTPAERMAVCERGGPNGAPCEHFRRPGCIGIVCCNSAEDRPDVGKWRLMMMEPTGRFCPLGKWGADPSPRPPAPPGFINAGAGRLATVRL